MKKRHDGGGCNGTKRSQRAGVMEWPEGMLLAKAGHLCMCVSARVFAWQQ